MTNQSAQTMPSQIQRVKDCAAMGIRFHADPEQIKALASEVAALSQPAGVADDMAVAEQLCRIYFEIAADALGEDVVRAERDRRISALAAAPAASGGEFVTVPRELTPSMLEAAEQEEACGNDFPEMWEAAIATYIFDKENDNG
jgi:hypothetical protein